MYCRNDWNPPCRRRFCSRAATSARLPSWRLMPHALYTSRAIDDRSRSDSSGALMVQSPDSMHSVPFGQHGSFPAEHAVEIEEDLDAVLHLREAEDVVGRGLIAEVRRLVDVVARDVQHFRFRVHDDPDHAEMRDVDHD